MMDRLPLQEALETSWDTDAHFVQYSLEDPDADLPRLRKEIVAYGLKVVANYLALDFDNANHSRWTDEQARRALAQLEKLTAPYDQWAAFYTTQHGYRLIYELAEPVSVHQFELLCESVLKDFKIMGFQPDLSCNDWTRVFRLPKVVRDGSKTESDPYFELLVRDGVVFVPPRFAVPAGTVAHGPAITFTEPAPSDLPDDIATRALLTNEEGKPTAWFTEARRRLKGRKCYEVLFEQSRLAEVGSRDSTIHALAGEAISILFYLPGSSPLLLYAIFLDPVLALEPDERGDFRSRTWRAVNRYWAREEARQQSQQKIEAKRLEVSETILDKIIRGFREWCDAPELHASDEAAAHYVSSRLIACTTSYAYVMRPCGYYDTAPLPIRLICAQIRALGMDALIPLQEIDANGKMKQIQAQTIIDKHATIIRQIEGISGGPDSPGAHIRQMGTDAATLEIPLFHRRSDLEPQYDRDIDGWLHSLVNPDDFEMLVNWIGHALALEDGPICALSLAGSPGIGKKMLVQGLAECINTQIAGEGKELFDEFQSHLALTPIFSINEGFPKRAFVAGKDPADKFRSLISGDPEPINQKYQPLMMIRNPLRLIFTANNLDVVSSLTAGRDLSPDDRAALAQRLLHLDCPDSAMTWLRMRGGLSYTSRKGRRWIRKDNGEKSDYVVARHFMHLWETRKPVPQGNRFLVEGSLTPTLIRIMAMRSGAAPLVIETLVTMIEKSRTLGRQMMPGIVVSEDRIEVTVSGIVDAFRADLGRQTKREIEAHQVVSVLRGIMSQEPTMKVPEVGSKKGRFAKYYQIDPHTLLEEAQEYGWNSAELAAMANKSPRRLAERDRFIRRVEKALHDRQE